MKSLRFIPMVGLMLASFPVVADFAGKQDSKQPIEINADSFEVLQNEKKAIFRGHVVAVQGKMTVRSDVMTVHYRQGSKAGGNAISTIDVDGNVMLISDQETASGETGVYNVDKRMLNLYRNVVVTKDKNVLKGEALEYNLATGRSNLTGGVAAAVSQAGQDGKPAAKPARVKALFVPEEGNP